MKPYKVISTDNREGWLKSREGVLTATQIARLMVGGPAEWKSVRGEFNGIRRDFDTKYMRWGREREPFIADYASTFIDSTLEPNDQFLISTRDPRIGATPDALGEDVVGEFKTSKHPMPPSLKDAKGGLEARYYVQTQVQMFVAGVDACAFVWEQHDDDWPEPAPYEPAHQIIEYDAEMQKRIVETVDRFFNDDATDDVSEAIVVEALNQLRELEEQKAGIDQSQEKLREQIREQLGEEDISMKFANASVSYYTPKPTARFDSKKFKTERPDIYEQYVKTGAPGARRLRITYAKEED